MRKALPLECFVVCLFFYFFLFFFRGGGGGGGYINAEMTPCYRARLDDSLHAAENTALSVSESTPRSGFRIGVIPHEGSVTFSVSVYCRHTKNIGISRVT